MKLVLTIGALCTAGLAAGDKAVTSSSLTSNQPSIRSGGSTPESVALYPYTARRFVCLEHPVGQLKSLGDALGSDCVIVGFGSGARDKFPMFYRGTGADNSDWIGWGAGVLAPFDGVVDSINLNPVTNRPGTLGKERASVITVCRSDGLRVLYAHVQEIMVQVGDTVKAGQLLAKVGNNGPAYFPHTHIGAYKGGQPLQVRFDLAAMSRSQSR
jgi:murein DD-endopeptidase MepM/ murein hydrolase activator NlpD